jgi:sporulation protein YlmC with PRC-barrel domain
MQKMCKLQLTDEKVMVNGRFRSPQPPHQMIEVERGMKIVVANGKEAGVVGAVMVNPHSEEITHLLLCRLPVTAVYRLIPINLLSHIDDDTIHLNIQCDDLTKLAVHQPA